MRLLAALVLFLHAATSQAQVFTTVEEFWQSQPAPATFPEHSQTILNKLREQFRASPKLAQKDPQFTRTFVLGKWLSFYNPSSSLFRDSATLQAFVQLAKQETLPTLLIASLDQADIAPGAAAILCQLYAAHPEAVTAYPHLAVAFAIVHDQPPPPWWPHHQVQASSLLTTSETVAERFLFLTESRKRGKLEHDPAKLTVNQLKFLVDFFIPTSELQWAQKNVRERTANFGKVFSSIDYSWSRIESQQYSWPAVPYTLETIKKMGGICVDQAYFACMAGKSHGLPTLFFVGQGRDGGHAWFGYLRTPSKWDLDCGRFESQNYPVGQAFDPQTWLFIEDSDLELLTSQIDSHPAYIPAKLLHYWAITNPNEPFLGDAAHNVRTALPNYYPAWRTEAMAMQKNPKPLEEELAFWLEWINQFGKLDNLKVEGQNGLLAVYKKAGKEDLAQALQDKIIKDNRRKRFDLGIGAAASSVFDLLEKEDKEGAEREFRKQVNRFNDQGGGTLFYQLVRPYIAYLLDAGDTATAERSLQYVERRLDRKKGGILDQELTDLEAKIAAIKNESPNK